ncbi:hypothetical protein NDU88_009175, partial [Pleurodeles waltl]
SAIRAGKPNAPLVEHFQLMRHLDRDLRWFILEKILLKKRGGNRDTLKKRRELWFVIKLETVKKELNSKEDWERG